MQVRALRPLAAARDRGVAMWRAAQVNPSNFLNLMAGIPPQPGDKVVPVGAYSCLLVGLHSHGWSHDTLPEADRPNVFARIKCDVCGHPHKLGVKYGHDHSSWFTREWYVHFPYDADAEEMSIYDFTAHSEVEHYQSVVYGSMLFKAYHRLVCAAPTRPVIGLHSFCGSSGTLKWMHPEVFGTRSQVDKW